MADQYHDSYNEAIRAALDSLRDLGVQLEEAFETRMGSFGMRNLNRSGEARVST
jgi:hypothetical protein